MVDAIGPPDSARCASVTAAMLEVKSPGKGLPPYKKDKLIGQPARRNLSAGDFFYDEDLSDVAAAPRRYHFVHPYGVPVRYHDLHQIAAACPLDLLEIHLSYKDLDVDLHRFFTQPLPHRLVVHSPELFSGDHILDLCADDVAYRQNSIDELRRVIAMTRELKQYFPASERPLIVVNVGGFSADRFIAPEEKKAKYALLRESLAQIGQAGIELIPQTMPGASAQPNPDPFAEANELRFTPNDVRLAEVGWTREDLTRVIMELGQGVWLGEYFTGRERVDIYLKTTRFETPEEMAAFGISGAGLKELFASHPPLEKRIEALRNAR